MNAGFYNMIDKLIKKWILALLGANNNQPIKGKKKFVNQMFIISKEIAKDKKLDESLEWFPDND